jgi:hypothetical protein
LLLTLENFTSVLDIDISRSEFVAIIEIEVS